MTCYDETSKTHLKYYSPTLLHWTYCISHFSAWSALYSSALSLSACMRFIVLSCNVLLYNAFAIESVTPWNILQCSKLHALPCLTLPCTIPFYSTLFNTTQHCPILPNIVQYYPTLSNTTLPKHCSSPHNSCTFSGLNTSLFSTLHRTQLIFAKTSRSWIDSMINWYKFTALCLKILETYFRLGGFFPVSLKTGTQKRAKM